MTFLKSWIYNFQDDSRAKISYLVHIFRPSKVNFDKDSLDMGPCICKSYNSMTEYGRNIPFKHLVLSDVWWDSYYTTLMYFLPQWFLLPQQCGNLRIFLSIRFYVKSIVLIDRILAMKNCKIPYNKDSDQNLYQSQAS